MSSTTLDGTSSAAQPGVAWDGRSSGFQGLLLGPSLVALVWACAAAASVWLTHGLAQHDSAHGLGVSLWWLALWLFVMMHVVFLGVGLMYHRALTHRACHVHPLAAYPLLLASLPAGTPVQWVGNHRHHHAATDDDEDWHSPHVHGFWAAHAGWYIYTRRPWLCALYTLAGPLRMLFDAFWRPQTNQEYAPLARDIARERFYGWVSRPTPYAFFVIGHVALTWCGAYLLWGVSAFLPLYLVQTSYYLIGDGVNSILHMWGSRPFNTRDESRNLPFLGFLAVGEGYHNGHHAFPKSARAGLLPGQFDLTYELARLLERLGLCRDLHVPSTRDILARLQDSAYREHFERKLERESRDHETTT
jgi:fatty-acid desaturase